MIICAFEKELFIHLYSIEKEKENEQIILTIYQLSCAFVGPTILFTDLSLFLGGEVICDSERLSDFFRRLSYSLIQIYL